MKNAPTSGTTRQAFDEGDGRGSEPQARRPPRQASAELAPKLVAHLERVDGDPKVREYYARFT
jgi:hypothetical protein